MTKEQDMKKSPNRADDNYNDEIDLYELLLKIWKWKWLIIGIVIFAVLVTYLYSLYNIKSSIKAKLINPAYTAKTIIKSASIIGQGIDSWTYNSPTITNISKIIEKRYSKSINIPAQIVGSKIEIDFKNDNDRTDFNKNNFSLKIEPVGPLYSLTITSPNAKLSLEITEYIVKLILREHKKLYIDGLNKLNKNIEYFKKKEKSESNIYFSLPYLLDSYNYQSEIISNPRLISEPESTPVRDQKLTSKLALAVIASLFLGIFLSFFIEFILSHQRERN